MGQTCELNSSRQDLYRENSDERNALRCTDIFQEPNQRTNTGMVSLAYRTLKGTLKGLTSTVNQGRC